MMRRYGGTLRLTLAGSGESRVEAVVGAARSCLKEESPILPHHYIACVALDLHILVVHCLGVRLRDCNSLSQKVPTAEFLAASETRVVLRKGHAADWNALLWYLPVAF
eukprot:1427866-Rhodomonas_salina.1